MTPDLHFSGSDFFLSADDLPEQLAADLRDCGATGDASEAVDYVISAYTVTGDPDDCRAYLAGCGAWEDDDLTDHDENLRRLVWLAGCDLREQGEIYFSAY